MGSLQNRSRRRSKRMLQNRSRRRSKNMLRKRSRRESKYRSTEVIANSLRQFTVEWTRISKLSQPFHYYIMVKLEESRWLLDLYLFPVTDGLSGLSINTRIICEAINNPSEPPNDGLDGLEIWRQIYSVFKQVTPDEPLSEVVGLTPSGRRAVTKWLGIDEPEDYYNALEADDPTSSSHEAAATHSTLQSGSPE